MQRKIEWYNKHNSTPFIEWTKIDAGRILPTGGAARCWSMLSVETFQKISMLNLFVSGKCLEELAPAIKVINEIEMGKGSGHWKSIECRLKHYRRTKKK